MWLWKGSQCSAHTCTAGMRCCWILRMKVKYFENPLVCLLNGSTFWGQRRRQRQWSVRLRAPGLDEICLRICCGAVVVEITFQQRGGLEVKLLKRRASLLVEPRILRVFRPGDGTAYQLFILSRISEFVQAVYMWLVDQEKSCPFVRSVAGGCWTLPALSFVTNSVNNFYEKNFYLLRSGERNQLRWVGHLHTITPWHLLGNKIVYILMGGDPGHCWKIMSID